MQLDDGGKVIGDLLQRAANLFARQLRGDLLEDHVAVARGKIIMGLFEARHGNQLPTPSTSFLGLTQHATQDPIEPCSHPRRVS